MFWESLRYTPEDRLAHFPMIEVNSFTIPDYENVGELLNWMYNNQEERER